MTDESKLAIHQVTLRDQWSFRECVEGLARHGVSQTAVWRDKLHEVGVKEGATILRDNGMRVTGLSVGGLATSPDPKDWQSAVDENRRVLEEAAIIGADHVVTISGGLVGDSKDLRGARDRTLKALELMLAEARGSGVKIGIEPLHPMMCANRAVLCTMEQANAWCDFLGDDESVGIVVDTYSVWWDPNMEREIGLAGPRICAFHVNDWLRDTRDLRLDRGMPGDGVIDIPAMRHVIEAAGYRGACEVEIFSERNWWRRDPDEVVEIIKQRFRECI